MTIELQNKVWSILPKEFKEEVKEIYTNAVEHHPCGYNHKTDLLKYLFGNHNLTSDAEGEETLICEKSKVQRAYNTSREIVKAENPDTLMYSMHTQIMCVLESIFGTKCLPDELNEDNFAKSEPKPAEPKNAEGEEILTCEKSKAMQLYSNFLDLVESERMSEHYSEWCDLEREYIALFGENAFADYFGVKCLPDEELKPTEPKSTE